MKKFFKAGIGIALLPICLAATIAFFHILKFLSAPGVAQICFISGMLVYAGFFLLSWKMTAIYVFGHEAVHAIIAFLCGAKIAAFRVSSRGGSVATTKSNFVISLAPYFLPLYTVLIGTGFLMVRLFYAQAMAYANLFLFLSGFSLSFHFFMTVDSLRIEQTDLSRNGYLFSLALIYLINMFVLSGILCAVFAPQAFPGFVRDVYSQTKSILIFIAGVMARAGQLAKRSG